MNKRKKSEDFTTDFQQITFEEVVKSLCRGHFLKKSNFGFADSNSSETENKTPVVLLVVCSPGETSENQNKNCFKISLENSPSHAATNWFEQSLDRLIHQHKLSRRQAQVALGCAEGLSNAEIAAKLKIRLETVKFHLRVIFIKFGIRRRGELIAFLYRQNLIGFNAAD